MIGMLTLQTNDAAADVHRNSGIGACVSTG